MVSLIFTVLILPHFAMAQVAADSASAGVTYGNSAAGAYGASQDMQTANQTIQSITVNQKQSDATLSPIATANDVVTKMLDKLPDGETKNGLKEYVSILGAKEYGNAGAGGSNKGLVAYFNNRFSDQKNSCVRTAAISFYDEMAKTLEYEKKTKVIRPGISEVSGEGQFKNLAPGWVWKLALKHAKGDPNSAMFLIGICGNDDTGHGQLSYQDSSQEALDQLRLRKQDYLTTKRDLEKRIQELSKNADVNQQEIYDTQKIAAEYGAAIHKLETENSITKNLSCPPQNSGFYAPQSLSKDADIPQSLKNEILETQKTVDGAKRTAGKYYHVYGSAFMACQLIQNGIGPTSASFIQQQAARVYRGVRMCESVRLLSASDDVEKTFKKYKVHSKPDLAMKVIEAIKSKKLDCEHIYNNKTGTYAEIPPECKIIYEAGYSPSMFTEVDGVGAEQIQKKLIGMGRNSDAASLYKSWYLGGGSIQGKKIPCSDIRMFGPNNLMKPDANFFDKLSKPDGWSDERYRAASQKLATWDNDFKWTIAQHKAGAEFAGKNCKKRAPGEKPLKGICPEGPPDGEAQVDLYSKRNGSAPSPIKSTEGTR
ncbi:hypothetical protein B9G69_012245 [Bdellovibrio sp. SKB1291214]|uniref:hypothetical protein n=1 Tax=Bdellovibrio sp. SKB1291214 TaxID=1732569 RepID=UPI000B5181A6|nr:hypothetical protein [Bdellovibrio sp. SKB1291214]UYL07816.1 hypothetical protein B9G69_012245 [Bdellovibrio sp. SKB1291214]